MQAEGRESIGQTLAIIRETEDSGLLVDRKGEGLSGLSGDKTVGLLQRLARKFKDDPTACYLETGVFQGLTLVSSALEGAPMPCFGIDNFSTLDPEGSNLRIVRQRMETFGAVNARLINLDFEDALEGLAGHLDGRRVGIYFVDGPHDYRSQLVSLMLVKNHLHENAVVVIDDANYPDVRWSTRDFLLGHPDFKMVFEAYTPAHPANMAPDEVQKWASGWLNGVHVLVRDSAGALPDMLPPVDPAERTLYLNEWLVHRLRLAELAPEAVALADAIHAGDGAAEETARRALLERGSVLQDRLKDRTADRNVMSAGLTTGRFNGFRS